MHGPIDLCDISLDRVEQVLQNSNNLMLYNGNIYTVKQWMLALYELRILNF